MRKWRVQFFLMGIMVAVFISNGPGISQAAHFSLTGTSNIHVSRTKSITLTGTCDSASDVSTPAKATTTIQPDPGESVGQAVTVSYCYSGSGTTSVTGGGYRAAGGIGSSTLTASCPFSYSNPNPLVVLLNPGSSQKTVFSYGPQTITGNQTLSVPNTCGNISAHIRDTLELDAGAFGVLDGPAPSSGTSASATITIDVNLSSPIGSASKLAFVQQPTNTGAGGTISPAVTVQVQDSNGNLVTSSTASITLAIGTNPSSGTLSGTTTVAAIGGVATFNNLSIDKAGTGYTLTATSTGLSGATSSAFNITAGAPTDTPGIWKLTGFMSTSRRDSAVAPLPDGRILVVGGTNTTGVDGSASTFYSTAEIYDPAIGTWSTTGSLTTGGRALHSATVLPNGKILITGGWSGSAALSSAEIYDPATGTFTPTGSMTTARANHRQIRLYTGHVLITGGFDSAEAPIASAEIYHEGTGTFVPTAAPMAAARSAHRLNTLEGGKVLVTGGLGAGGTELASAEIFDPATGTFGAAGSLAHARANHGATVLPSGEVIVTGGLGSGGVLNSTEIYDPDTNTFTAGPTLNQARQHHASQLLPNGKVIISGGNTDKSSNWDVQTEFLSSAELYDPATNTFTVTGSKVNATSGGNPILVWTGKFLVAGGGTNEAELYDPEMPGTPETWVATGNMVTARSNPLWSLLDDGRLLIVGGLDSVGNPLASAELYDYLTKTFSSTGNMATPRQQHRTVALYTGDVLVTGGRPNASSNVLNSAELFHPVNGTFTSAGNMLQYRRLHRSTELHNGKILITGGLGGASNTANNVLSSAELYDPATGTFTQTTGGLITARRSHQAILLYTGKVLIAGGFGANSVLLNSAELYDPSTDTFTATGNMITARVPFLTRLPNGKILVSNGSDAAGNPIQALEIYDPATGIFTAAGNELLARDGDRVDRLDNGKIILVGGQTTANATSVTNSAELYSHVTRKFSATGNLITGRQGFAQSDLPNGQVLAAGGVAADGTVLSSAELYSQLIADEVDTTITSGPDLATTSTSATFTFTATDPNSTFTCSLDGSPFAACTSPQNFSSLASGNHNFQVHATDSLGNTDRTPANYNWTIESCTYTISPTNKNFNANGGSVSVKVSTTGQANCPAPLVGENVDWISVSGTPAWKANKETVKIAVQKNPSSQSRIGMVSIGGQNLTITEAGATCQMTALKPSSEKFPNAGGSGNFAITVSPQDCGWNVATTFGWIHLDTTTGTGNGTATFRIDANGTGKNITGKINVSLTQNPTKKKTFTVNESK